MLRAEHSMVGSIMSLMSHPGASRPAVASEGHGELLPEIQLETRLPAEEPIDWG
jgi:hypothetical protein